MISVKGDAMTSCIGFINLIGISSLPVDVSFLREITLATRMMRQRIAEVLQSEDAVLINDSDDERDCSHMTSANFSIFLTASPPMSAYVRILKTPLYSDVLDVKK